MRFKGKADPKMVRKILFKQSVNRCLNEIEDDMGPRETVQHMKKHTDMWINAGFTPENC